MNVLLLSIPDSLARQESIRAVSGDSPGGAGVRVL
jgi:hypothetical protein